MSRRLNNQWIAVKNSARELGRVLMTADILFFMGVLVSFGFAIGFLVGRITA